MIDIRRHSLSVFFPCYNDKGTIATLIWDAKKTAEKLTDDFEIIIIDDGSTDGAREMLMDFKLKNEIPQFKLVLHETNRGYGGAVRSGFATATKDLIFYTDGDGQYDVQELPRLWEKMTPDIAIVNGFKVKRHDPWSRVIIGSIYQYVMKLIFLLPIKDVDCDFRLIRRRVFDTVELTSATGTITIELVKKIQQAGFKFAQAPVSHHFRTYGKSQFFNFKRVSATLWKLAFLWVDLMFLQKLTRPDISIVLRKIVDVNFRKQRAIIRERFSHFSSGAVLDLGSGTGEFSAEFPKEMYVGIDIDPRNIAYAKTRYPDKTFIRADARKLPFQDNTFDKIFVVGVFHHLADEDAKRVVGEMKRVLKKAGALLVIEDTVSSAFFTRIMRAVDQGRYMRSTDGWKTFFNKHFSIQDSWTFKNGLCFYSAFIMAHEKNN